MSFNNIVHHGSWCNGDRYAFRGKNTQGNIVYLSSGNSYEDIYKDLNSKEVVYNYEYDLVEIFMLEKLHRDYEDYAIYDEDGEVEEYDFEQIEKDYVLAFGNMLDEDYRDIISADKGNAYYQEWYHWRGDINEYVKEGDFIVVDKDDNAYDCPQQNERDAKDLIAEFEEQDKENNCYEYNWYRIAECTDKGFALIPNFKMLEERIMHSLPISNKNIEAHLKDNDFTIEPYEQLYDTVAAESYKNLACEVVDDGNYLIDILDNVDAIRMDGKMYLIKWQEERGDIIGMSAGQFDLNNPEDKKHVIGCR